MRLNAVKILKISITTNPKNEILEEIQKYLSLQPKNRQKTLKIFTPNTEQLVFASKHNAFLTVLNRADVKLPDANGVVWAGRVLTKSGPKNPIPGVEFMDELTRLAATHHVPVGLIGGRGNLAVDTLNCLRETHPELVGWGEDGPEIQGDVLPDDLYFSRLGRRIIREGTKIVFVALGPPKQEYFIERLVRETPKGVIYMAVGGSFDILSGRLPRAPKWMRDIGLEWFWRLILEPGRVVRQLALVEFVWLVLREKLFGTRG